MLFGIVYGVDQAVGLEADLTRLAAKPRSVVVCERSLLGDDILCHLVGTDGSLPGEIPNGQTNAKAKEQALSP